MNVDLILKRNCDGCRFNKSGRKSDCQIKMVMLYNSPASVQFREWCAGQLVGWNCKQRKPK